MTSVCLQNIVTRTGQPVEKKGMGPVLQHRLQVPLAFEGGISPCLEASARAPGYPNGWGWFEASCLSAWVSLLVKGGEDTGGTSSQMLLALAVLQVAVRGLHPFCIPQVQWHRAPRSKQLPFLKDAGKPCWEVFRSRIWILWGGKEASWAPCNWG